MGMSFYLSEENGQLMIQVAENHQKVWPEGDDWFGLFEQCPFDICPKMDSLTLITD